MARRAETDRAEIKRIESELDQRIAALVSAIGQLIARRNGGKN